MDNEDYKVTNPKQKRLVAIIVVIAVAAAAAIASYTVAQHRRNVRIEYVEERIEQPVSAPADEDDGIDIDFDELQSLNPDIYAWIDIPDTTVSYPVLQHQTDHAYYLTHSYDKSSSYSGAIFTQGIYNGIDFSDSCTVLYGHRMRNGTMFAPVSEYMDREFFDEHDTIYIYTPTSRLEYEVFAAVPFDNRNILHTWDCSDSHQFGALLQTILDSRTVDSNIKEDYKIDFYNDKIIILSTCYPGDNTHRYLVAAKLLNQ